MSNFDFNLLKPLEALLRLRNVTEAARELDISQPTVSGMLQRLREQLGDALLVRVGNRFELTPRAVELAVEVRQTLLRLEQLITRRTTFDPQNLHRHFKIMVSEFGLFLILPRLFQLVAQRAPHLTFSVFSIDQPVVSVYSGDIDLCLTGDSIADIEGSMASSVRAQQLIDDIFLGVVDTTHPLRGRINLEQFLGFPHIATQFPNSNLVVEDLGIKGLSDRHPPWIRVASFMAIGEMVAGSRSIGVVPGRLALFMCTNPRLRTLELPDEFAKIAIRALWHVRYDHDLAHHWLRELLATACAELSSTLDAGSAA